MKRLAGYCLVTALAAVACRVDAQSFTSPGERFRVRDQLQRGAANPATANRYLKGNGTSWATSSGSASGTGACTNQFVRTLNSDAAPTCATVALGTDTSGAAPTATALAANGTNCSAGSYPLGVDASGNSESCTVAASTAADYITGSAQSTLSAEQSLGALTTGLLLNTSSAGTGTLSQYGGTSCTNQFPRSLNASGAATCATVTSGDTSGTFPATAHNLLSSTHGDTLAASVVAGDILVGNATPAWSRVAHPGAAGRYVKSTSSTAVGWSTGSASGTGSCTNQAVTALNSDAAPTCTTIALGTYTSGNYVASVATNHSLTGGAAGSAGAAISLDITTSPTNAATVVGTGRTLTAGTEIATLGDLSADRTISAPRAVVALHALLGGM